MAKTLSILCVLLLTSRLHIEAATISCVAGCGEGAENTALGAKFVEPFAVAFDKQGNWYVCEHKGERIVRIDGAGGANVLAGTGREGNSGDGGPASQATMLDPHG